MSPMNVSNATRPYAMQSPPPLTSSATPAQRPNVLSRMGHFQDSFEAARPNRGSAVCGLGGGSVFPPPDEDLSGPANPDEHSNPGSQTSGNPNSILLWDQPTGSEGPGQSQANPPVDLRPRYY